MTIIFTGADRQHVRPSDFGETPTSKLFCLDFSPVDSSRFPCLPPFTAHDFPNQFPAVPKSEPTKSPTLSELIAKAKADQKTKTDALEPHRATLLKERSAGTSVRIMVGALAQLGVSVSEETLRLWFLRQESDDKAAVPKKSKTAQQSKATAGTPPAPAAPNTRARVAREDI
jgi:hypothetical protein